MKYHIYADNAATTKLDIDAFKAMMPYLIDKYGNASQPYSFSRDVKSSLKEARNIIASCINAEPEEIYFTSGGTESDNWAIKGLYDPKDERYTIVSSIEHHAILNSCKTLELLGNRVLYLPVSGTGIVDLECLKQVLKTNRTRLVSIMLANNEIGSIEPIKDLVQIAHEFGSLFHTDAVQAIGHISVDVKQLGVDMLSASAHKFNGPKGIGFLYIKKGVLIRSFNDGGHQESGLRAGTENIASIIGMSVALKNNCNLLHENEIKLKKLEQIFIETLSNARIDFLRNGSRNHIPGNINVSFPMMLGETLLHRLDLKGISVSTGSACDSVNNQISHVIKAISIPKEYASGTLRISFSKDNSFEDARNVALAIVDIINLDKKLNNTH